MTRIAESELGLKYSCGNFMFATVDIPVQGVSGGLRGDNNARILFQPCSPPALGGAACVFMQTNDMCFAVKANSSNTDFSWSVCLFFRWETCL